MNLLRRRRHYIFIDAADIHADLTTHATLTSIKKIHKGYYTNNERVDYWGYNDIARLLKGYDAQLHELFLQLNYNYAALLADIGRLIILYVHGGVYHDLKYTSDKRMITYLDKIDAGVSFIGDVCSTDRNRTRNGNMIALRIHHPLLHECLQKIKAALIVARRDKALGAKYVAKIGSDIYNIDVFKKYEDNKTVIKYCMDMTLINYDITIYRKRSTVWQKINEHLFRYI